MSARWGPEGEELLESTGPQGASFLGSLMVLSSLPPMTPLVSLPLMTPLISAPHDGLSLLSPS